jgi:large subunit ribosomal protein L13
MLRTKTYSPKPGDITRAWHVVDATGEPLGRLSSRVAQLLMGKHKPGWAPHMDTGDYVVVLNAAKIKLTGRKMEQMFYFRHSGYAGGAKVIPLKDVLAKHPTRVIEHAVRGMLPHSVLGRYMRKKLKVYAGAQHPHAGQVNPGPPRVARPRRQERVAPPAESATQSAEPLAQRAGPAVSAAGAPLAAEPTAVAPAAVAPAGVEPTAVQPSAATEPASVEPVGEESVAAPEAAESSATEPKEATE